MAASAILAKFGTRTTLTITLASLASSTAGVGRQSTIVDNTTNRFQLVRVHYSIKLGTSPASNKGLYFYLIADDGTTTRSDGAGASDAGLTVKNADQVGGATTGPSAATGDVLSGSFLIRDPGPNWGLAVVQDSAVNLDSTAVNHVMAFEGINPESQ